MNFIPRIEHLGGGMWLVESASRPGELHSVNTIDRQCSCEAGTRSPENRCWHLSFVYRLIDRAKEIGESACKSEVNCTILMHDRETMDYGDNQPNR